jgi:hypothetical protein
VRTLTQPYIDAVMENNNCVQIIKTGFAGYFYAFLRMRPEQILKTLVTNSLKGDIDTTFNATLFSLVKTFSPYSSNNGQNQQVLANIGTPL